VPQTILKRVGLHSSVGRRPSRSTSNPLAAFEHVEASAGLAGEEDEEDADDDEDDEEDTEDDEDEDDDGEDDDDDGEDGEDDDDDGEDDDDDTR